MNMIDELGFEYTGDGEELQARVSEVATADDNLRQLQSLYNSLIESVDSFWSPTLLHTDEFSPRDFELLIGCLWEQEGYEVCVTPPSDDGGVDVIIKKDRRGTFIEAKNTGVGNNVGVREVRNLFAAASNPDSVDYEILSDIDTIAEIIVITTSGLTSQAIRFMNSVSNSTDFDVTVMNADHIVYSLNKSELTPNNWRDYLTRG